MKKLGLIRRMDEFGRVAIPKEFRNMLKFEEGQPLEFFINEETNEVIIKKYIVED